MRRISLLAVLSVSACALPDEEGVHEAELAIVTCDSLHAIKIAADYKLASCDQLVPDGRRFASAGAGLRDDQICTGVTANKCAGYFRANPEKGLVDNGPPGDAYEAMHFATEGDLLMPDGTRPLLYFRPGSGDHVNDWIIFIAGGANMCTAELVQAEAAGTSTVSQLGLRCYDKLDYARNEEGVAGTGFHRDRWKDLSQVGILGEVGVNPAFATYNRVWIEKPNDGFLGAAVHRNVVARIAPSVWRAEEVQTRGDEIVHEALAFLAGTRGLAHAHSVLFVASSSGVNAVHRIDAWADAVRTHTSLQPAYVGMMLNSQIMGAEPWVFEARDSAPCASVYGADCPTGHDDPPAGHLAYRLEAGGTRRMTFDHRDWLDYVAEPYVDSASPIASGDEWVRYESVGAQLDASCVAAETAEPWRCRSRQYVMLHHVATPLFLAHSFHDGSDAVIKGQTTRLSSGALPTWDDVAAANPTTVEPPFETLTRALLEAYVDHRDTGAVGASRGAGPIGVWATDCAKHEPEKSYRHFASGEVRIDDGTSSVTLSEALRDWFERRVPTIRIDGRAGANTDYSGAASTPDGCVVD